MIMDRIKKFLKTEPVLLISIVLAAVSAFIVKPGEDYLGYIDFRTLALLFCLMTVMAGLGRLGVFRVYAAKMLRGVGSVRALTLILNMLCFFSAMLITNDVALITFVPFTVEALRISGKKEKLIPIVVLETVSANLGSMLTPIGNPQNLYLFSAFEMSIGEFVSAVLPYTVLSLILVTVFSLVSGKEKTECPAADGDEKISAGKVSVYAVLFAVSILTVFKVIPYPATLAVTVAAVLIFDRKTLLGVDYSLLLTFVFLFIFIGNLGNIASVSEFLKKIVIGNEVIAGIAASQVFSNVPAALLLSGFTDNAKDLLIGVNLGGLGTLIASMASLISFKIAVKEDIKSGRYLLVFTVVNVVFLAANIILRIIIK
ncbi:MAG: citrate transporter [Clostridia bacterium]|nr:citrate transporter [Clostridia bacterium]